ncbi:MAG: ATP-dependent DNA helicase RecQ [Alphaproteobacteria bacterium HGW-Alphaproteobacteria-1]|nr:MAG: ATP-dependent DNA helicase RecQ [Alphaproteobacteria bacterium HGW-Alphaproteobacteria-1]
MSGAATLLRDVFGFDAFRPGQEEIVHTVASGCNTLAIMPTGGGKSLCFQLPALMRDGVTVVVSPLIALMRDQVRALRAVGVAAGALTSGNTEEETADVWRALDEGRLKLLYLAPERLAASGTTAMLRRVGVNLIAVDEAHCVSQWGHDFRPDYLRIGELRRALDVPLAAFTATADAETQAEIIEKLFDGTAPQSFLYGFDRPNIHLAFAPKDNPRRQVLDFVAARRGQSGIVYCGTRARTETLAQALSDAGHAACAYHGGMEAPARREVEERFNTEDGLIVVATVAFGMGVDKPDIRWVAHADLPKSPERRNADHGRLNALLGLAEALECRRVSLLRYFGEAATACGNCDLCDAPPESFDGTEAVRMALSAMLRTGESFGAGHLIDILTGTLTDKVRTRGHDALPTFGVGRAHDKRLWQGVFRQMMGHDLVRPDAERHGALVMCEGARPILRGEAMIRLRQDTLKVAARPAPRALVSDEDAPLLSALKAKRRALAEAAGVPAYIVFTDRTLIEMAETRPATIDAMARIGGVGATKLERYGTVFLEVITGAGTEAMHPTRRKLAGRPEGALYDRLAEVSRDLARGECGTLRPLSCTHSTLRQIAERRPATLGALERLPGMDPQKTERFGAAFLDVIAVQKAGEDRV